jgi:two-component system probable response regulator PhcQ
MRTDHADQPAGFQTEWIEDLSREYEKWVLGTLDLAA